MTAPSRPAVAVAVVGCGLMGSGIAEVMARAGRTVVVHEVDEAAAGRGRARIETSLGRAVRIGKLDESGRDEVLDRIAVGTDLDKRFVYVVGQDKAVAYRAVTLGPLVDGLRVVRNGLKPDEVVLVNGLQRVRPGSPVDAKIQAMEPASQERAQ